MLPRSYGTIPATSGYHTKADYYSLLLYVPAGRTDHASEESHIPFTVGSSLRFEPSICGYMLTKCVSLRLHTYRYCWGSFLKCQILSKTEANGQDRVKAAHRTARVAL